MKKPEQNRQKPNKGLMFKANKVIKAFADEYGLTHCSFADGYKMVINGSNIINLYTNKLEYRVEGQSENKYLPVGEKNLRNLLTKELQVDGNGRKTISLIRVVR